MSRQKCVYQCIVHPIMIIILLSAAFKLIIIIVMNAVATMIKSKDKEHFVWLFYPNEREN